MYLNGTWLVNELIDATGLDFRWGTFAWPEISGGANGLETANFGSQVFAVNRNTSHPQEAFELIVHLTTGHWDEALARESFGIPVSGTADWPPQLAEAEVVFASLTQPISWVAGVEDNSELGSYVRLNVQRLVGGGITAEEFVENIRERR
jgi:raffinose/stachyose/melibiose transport system substrate-binding protein